MLVLVVLALIGIVFVAHWMACLWTLQARALQEVVLTLLVTRRTHNHTRIPIVSKARRKHCAAYVQMSG